MPRHKFPPPGPRPVSSASTKADIPAEEKQLEQEADAPIGSDIRREAVPDPARARERVRRANPGITAAVTHLELGEPTGLSESEEEKPSRPKPRSKRRSRGARKAA
jgi:hypothetical protein